MFYGSSTNIFIFVFIFYFILYYCCEQVGVPGALREFNILLIFVIFIVDYNLCVLSYYRYHYSCTINFEIQTQAI